MFECISVEVHPNVYMYICTCVCVSGGCLCERERECVCVCAAAVWIGVSRCCFRRLCLCSEIELVCLCVHVCCVMSTRLSVCTYNYIRRAHIRRNLERAGEL